MDQKEFKSNRLMNNNRDNELASKLLEVEDRFRSITETSIDGIVTSDGHDQILSWNRGAERMFGYGKEIIGMPVTTIIPERYRQAHLDGMKRFLKTGKRHLIGSTLEIEAVRKDGNEFPIELSLSTWEGSLGVYFGAIMRDVSERKQIESIREDVERMMRHDLKSPLIGMTGMAKQLLKGSNLTEKQIKMAEFIKQLGERTIRMIRRSRDLFQMEQGKYELCPKPVCLVDIIYNIQDELKPIADRRHVITTIKPSRKQIEDESEYAMMGETSLLETMFANLIKNAIEASPRGKSVTIEIKPEVRGTGKYLIVDIHNFSPIPDEIKDTFFEPYVTSKKKGGTGLGTHSAKLVAEAHRGHIAFNTSKKEGTHIIVTLPR
jgi:PAS domain S-box-containing protein